MEEKTYYLIAVAHPSYHGEPTLTYSAVNTQLTVGMVVSVPLQRKEVLGYVVAKTTKPKFKTRDIVTTYPELGALPATTHKLREWLQAYYPSPSGIVTSLFLPKQILKKDLTNLLDTANDSGRKSVKLPPLYPHQEAALEQITKPGSYVLHGETGSGKTRVYIELALQALLAGKSSIILIPEISLSSQLAEVFIASFPNETVVVLHSKLTEAERRRIWITIQMSKKPRIIIGPRSALFSPLKDIGLIVIDESHEFTYKQESQPYYHTTRVASTLASLHGSQLILGSATPSVSDYFVAEQKQRPIIMMQQPVHHSDHAAKIAIVDMRDTSQLSRDPQLSTTLISSIQSALNNKQQSLLFINRRGTARIVLCDNCGWQATCPHCDLPLTYHHDSHAFRCHICNHKESAKHSCPTCGNTDITLKSIGTKAIASSIERLFPSARIARFDTDNNKGERIHEVYDQLKDGSVDILIGTQMLAKGLDLPNLGVVGVINADASLYIPDYTAQERTFQLLYQVLGRIGRGHQENTTAVIQTYSPENETIKSAITKDWSTFYNNELAERQAFTFPPYCYLLKISCKRVHAATAQKNAEKVAALLRTQKLAIEIDGPAPAFHEKVQNGYVWQIIIKAKDRNQLIKAIRVLPKDWSYDIDPINLL
jgi:primosomal protein N' (replication factor Y) (superfamily II helicase)